jgi:hypothetical protein
VKPGATISMRMDEEKIRDNNRELAEPKQKFDLADFLSKTVSVIVSLASVVIIAARL